MEYNDQNAARGIVYMLKGCPSSQFSSLTKLLQSQSLILTSEGRKKTYIRTFWEVISLLARWHHQLPYIFIETLFMGARRIFAETCSRAKRWPVVGARFIAPRGWRGAHVRMSLPHPVGAINRAPTGTPC